MGHILAQLALWDSGLSFDVLRLAEGGGGDSVARKVMSCTKEERHTSVLHQWQQEAVSAWVAGDTGGPFRGTLEIFTGGGKTLIALACIAKAQELCPSLRVAVVVPTEALCGQWIDNLLTRASFSSDEVGLLGAGGKDTFKDRRCLVCVLNTASRKLSGLVRNQDETMLVIDECHRAGAPTFSRVLETPAKFRLGLSATPDREELDEDGVPVAFDEQLVGKSIGSVVYRFSLRNAREVGWLPDYDIHHHGLELSPDEQRRYDEDGRRIDDLANKLNDYGVDAARARRASGRRDEIGRIARAYVAATAHRKGVLYKAAERERVTVDIVQDVCYRKPNARVLLFHERVDDAVALHSHLVRILAGVPVALEHSKLSAGERGIALADFKSGRARVLVSVKSLVEGIDVPEADVGISVASSSSVRQRIQSLGRVLRRSFGDELPRKQAEMHILYVSKTVDEAIYGKEDWADITGVGANHYWHWAREPQGGPSAESGPPQEPMPTEEQEWDRLGDTPVDLPQRWYGQVPPNEYSIDAMGNVATPYERIVSNPQGVDRMVVAVRGSPGGRFYVTPIYRFVVIRNTFGEAYVAGRLKESFALRDESVSPPLHRAVSGALRPGDRFDGSLDRSNGSYRLSQKRGGVIERRDTVARSSEYALASGGQRPALEENAKRILTAWRTVAAHGLEFHLTADWHAWFLQGGEPRYLGCATGGFAWPSDDMPEHEGGAL